MSAIEATVDALKSLNLQALKSEVDNLRAIKEWALAQLKVDYRPGDRVVITSARPSEAGGGWHHYREALAPGQTGIAGEITFNSFSNCWQVLVGLDRTWSVHERGWGDTAGLIRYWNGPADETPEGYEPPRAYDQERHPDGKVKHFAMKVEWLAKAVTE